MRDWTAATGIVILLALAGHAQAAGQPSSGQAFLNQYCITCHNQRLKTGGLTLDELNFEHAGEQAETWEKVVRKLRAA